MRDRDQLEGILNSLGLNAPDGARNQELLDLVDDTIDGMQLTVPLRGIRVEPESKDAKLFGVLASRVQTGLNVYNGARDGAIAGTLLYVDFDPLKTDWGAGNFMMLKFSGIPDEATSVKVGLYPSQGSGLVEIIDDPDKNGVFKVTDKATQKFKVEVSDGTNTTTQLFDLSGLACETGE